MYKSSMNNLPEFKSPFLTEIAFSFSKVRKSLKHNSHSLNFVKVIDRIGDREAEKIEFSIRSSNSRDGIIARLYAWDERWIWIDARMSIKKGWEWEYTTEGRLSGTATVRELVEAQKTFYENAQIYGQDYIDTEANSHWSNLIATGPKGVPHPNQ